MRDWKKNDFLAENKRRDKEREKGNYSANSLLVKSVGRKFREMVEGLNAIFALDEVKCTAKFSQNKLIFSFEENYFVNTDFVATVDRNCLGINIECTKINSDKIDQLLAENSTYLKKTHIERNYIDYFSSTDYFRIVRLNSILDSAILTNIFLTFAEELADHATKRIKSYSAFNYSGLIGHHHQSINTYVYESYAKFTAAIGKSSSNKGWLKGKVMESLVDSDVSIGLNNAAESNAIKNESNHIVQLNLAEGIGKEVKLNMRKYGKDIESIIAVDTESGSFWEEV